MKTLYKTATILLLVGGLAIAAKADFVVGSWQGTTDDGWHRDNGGGTDIGSILAPSNSPSAFVLQAGVVTGYAQSLAVHEYGYGNCRPFINLTSINGGLAAWLANSTLNFTFSIPPDEGNHGGYIQLAEIQYNSDSSGWHQITGSSTPNFAAAGFTATGNTNNNYSTGQPNFYYNNTAPYSPAQSQVVSWNYSSIKASIGATPSYLNIVFVFQVGNGAPTNLFLNNVTLSAPNAGSGTTNYIIDQFNAFGYGPANQYVGTNNYSTGGIINVWTNWFGSAWVTNSWDSTNDVNSNPSSGSLKIRANFAGGNSPGQFVVFDGFNGISPALSALTNGFTSFQCDVMFAPGSATCTNSSTKVVNYGHLQFGTRNGNDQYWFSLPVEIPVGTNTWTHVNIPISYGDANLLAINDVLIKIDGDFYTQSTLNGVSTLWVDNIMFVAPTNYVMPSPPTLTIQKATPGLRIFAGSTGANDRTELATVDQHQSWIGGTYPVSYSFTLLSYPANIGQTHIFLIPTWCLAPGNNGIYNNEYVDWQASNALWLDIQPYPPNGAYASIYWKTNLAGASPNHTQVVLTNTTAVGTWTLKFTGPGAGTVTGPDGTSGNFTIADANVATDFANPLVAYFGLQPNSGTGVGQYEDWGSITVSGLTTGGVNENDNFTTDTSFNTALWSINTATPALNTSVQLVTPSTPYWVSWTLPAAGYDLGTATNVNADVNNNTIGTPNAWLLPEYYNQYADGKDMPGGAAQGSSWYWVLVPTNCLPTVDGMPYGEGTGVPAPNAFFMLFNPSLSN